MMKLTQLLNKNKRSFIVYIVGALLTTPANILVTLALSYIFKVLDATSTQETIQILTVTAFLAYLPIFLQIISRYMRIGFMKDILLDVRMMSYRKLLSQKTSEFSKQSIDTYQSKLINDINLFEQEFFLSVLNIIFSVGSFIITIIVLFTVSFEIALITIFASILMYVMTKTFEKPILKNKEKIMMESAKYQKGVTNILSGLETIMFYQASKRFLKVFNKDVVSYEDMKSKDYFLNEVSTNLLTFVAFLIQVIGYIYALFLFSNQKLSLEGLVIVINITGNIQWTIIHLMSMINRFKSSHKIYEEIVRHDDIVIEPNTFKFDHSLLVSNLNYAYGENLVLNNINLNVKKNDKVLIYGESGSGKTTFINTLVKNLDDFDGRITYDQIPLETIDYESLNKGVGYVRQEHFLFNDSIKNNIVLDKAFYQERFDEVLKMSSIYDFVHSLEDQEEFQLLDNGSNISGGQRQRLNIARELYQDKPIIILDEPSASLDDLNASIIYKNLLSLNKTILIISHRHLEYLKENVDVSQSLSEVQ